MAPEQMTGPARRFDTALKMAEALDTVFPDDAAPSHEIAAWLNAIALTVLAIVSAFFLAVGLVATSVRALSGPPATTAP